MTEDKTFDELLEDITSELSNIDVCGLAEIASIVLDKRVEFMNYDYDRLEYMYEVRDV